MAHANVLLLTAAAFLLLPGCKPREEKYSEAQAPVGVKDSLSISIPHFVADTDKICCLIVLRNSGTKPLTLPLKPNNAKDDAHNAFYITVANGGSESKHSTSKITNDLPTGYNKWAHAVGNFNTAKNLGQTATGGVAVVPAQGQSQIELTFTIDPEMPSKKSPWVLTVQHVVDDKNQEISASVSIK